MRTRLVFGNMALLLVWLSACSNSSLPDNQSIQQNVSLENFASCSKLEKYLKDTAELEMRSTIEMYKPLHGYPTPTSREGGATPASMSGGPDAYTQTNNQVLGVDEADIVKNDGTRIFVITGRSLYLLNSWPPADLRIAGRLDLEGHPWEMFFEGNRLVVFSGVPIEQTSNGPGGTLTPVPLTYPYWDAGVTKISVVDVSDLSNPRLQFESYVPGRYVTSRRVASSIRVVLQDYFRWPQGVKWFPEIGPHGYDNAALAAAYDKLVERNARVIRNASLEEYLPRRVLKKENGSPVNIAYSCSEFSRTSAPTQLGYLTVASLNLDDLTRSLSRQTIVSQSGPVYASAKNLYVSTAHWWWKPHTDQRAYTYFHKFDLSQPNQVRYAASGGTEGYVSNQFSLDEFNDNLRVATNLWSIHAWRPGSPWPQPDISNRITIFGQDDNALQVIGQSIEIGKGEQIYGVRFIGDKGFVVTFRQIDPLFTFDLSDPRHPRQVGELQVPGFSTYVHPLDEAHLLTIGEYRDPSSRWGSRLVQLSIFDVSDLAHPRQSFTQTVGSHYGFSEALYNHKAFNYFPERKLLAIPLYDWNPGDADIWRTFVSDLRVFHVDVSTGFEAKGSLSMSDIFQERRNGNWTWWWRPAVHRSVMADNFVYAISDAAVRVADVDTLQSPIQTAQFIETAY